MFEIFVYLFENYFYADACPEPERLARKLSAAGFEDEDITDALEWLSGLRELSEPSPKVASAKAMRFYCSDEEARLSRDCRGFLVLLENAGAVTPATREMIIERAMALPDLKITLARFKVIALMVLWSQDEPLSGLILEELPTSEEEEGWRH
jgi:Smg protein